MLELRTFETIEAVPRAAWDTLAAGHAGMSYPWLRFLEAAARDYRPQYTLVEDEAGPLLGLLRVRWMQSGAPPLARVLTRRIVSLSAPYCASNSGLLLRPGLSLEEALPAVDRALRELERRTGCWLTDLSTRAEEGALFQRIGFHVGREEPTSCLELTSPDYDVYAQTLSGRQRKEVGRLHRQMESKGVTFRVLREPGPDGAAIQDIIFETLAHHAGPHGPPARFSSRLMEAAGAHLGGRLRIVVGDLRGEPVVCGLGHLCDGELHMPMAGLRYAAFQEANCLYPLMLEHTVRLGLAEGVRRIYAGTSNYQAKRKFGFLPLERVFLYRARGAPLNAVMGRVRPWVEATFFGSPEPSSPPEPGGGAARA